MSVVEDLHKSVMDGSRNQVFCATPPSRSYTLTVAPDCQSRDERGASRGKDARDHYHCDRQKRSSQPHLEWWQSVLQERERQDCSDQSADKAVGGLRGNLATTVVPEQFVTALSGWIRRKMFERYSHTHTKPQRCAVEMLSALKAEPDSPQTPPQPKGIVGGSSRKPLILKMVGKAGFEPATPGLEGRCSIQLSYSPVLLL
jgi:hypothetical protein